MANSVYTLRGAGGLPLVSILERKGGLFSAVDTPANLKRHIFGCTANGFAMHSDSNATPTYRNLGIASGLPSNNFEVLIRCTVLQSGSSNFLGTGVCAVFSSDKTVTGATNGYQLGMGSASSVNAGAIISRNAAGASTILANGIIASVGLGPMYIRARRSGANLYLKAWVVGSAEPGSWSLTTSSSLVAVTCFYLQTYGVDYSAIVHEVAVATNGDTAVLGGTPVQALSGSIGADTAARLVSIVDLETNVVCEVAYTDPSTGNWSASLYHSRPVYARIDALNGQVLDLIFAKGSGYLAGEFPGGITTVDGAPVSATVRVLYRGSGNLDGVVVAEVSSDVDGTWTVGGLNTALKFDVIGRKVGFNDVIMANVSPV